MSYKVKSLSVFERQAKRLKKKFPSLKKELKELIDLLKEEPRQGNHIGHDCYKIRLAIESKGKGKSGGGRIITQVIFIKEKVYLLTIYDKSEIADISDKELLRLIGQIPE